MSDYEPDKPYVYQPLGSVSHPEAALVGRLYGVSGISLFATIKGLTKAEAEVVRDALISLHAREALTRLSQAIGGYEVTAPSAGVTAPSEVDAK